MRVASTFMNLFKPHYFLPLAITASIFARQVYAGVTDISDVDNFDLAEMSLFYKCKSGSFSAEIAGTYKSAELKADHFSVVDLKKNPSVECNSDGVLWRLEIATELPTSSNGYCAGAQQGSLTVFANGKGIVKGRLINYCTGWGLDAFRAGYGSITTCGVGDVKNGIDGRLYGCVSYDKKQFLEQNMRVVDSPTNIIK